MGPNGAGRRDISQAVSAIPGVFKDSGLRGMTMMFAAMPVAVVAGKKAVDVGGAYIKRIVAPEAFDVLGKGFYTKINPKSLAHASFEDVIGHADAKAELLRFLEQAQTPKLNAALNKANPRRMMNNVLLAGPPGTGKTELARALASELNKGSKTTFFNVDVEKLLQLEPGTGARNVGQLRKAIQKSRSDKVILFMDEIDGLTSRSMAGANPETNKTITAILKLIDGVEPIKGKEILVVGASNHPRVMDEALINRFRRVIKVGAPNRDELTEMYQLYARKKALVPSGEIDWHAVADHSGQYTGRTVEQAMQTLQERLLSGMPKEELKRIEKSLGKNGKVRKNPVQLSFTQEQLLEAVKAVQKPRYQGDYALIA
ncbi:MAG: AAA family ATPase [Candidatus Melainabacteria bacterium]